MPNNNTIILLFAVILGGMAAILARNWLANHAEVARGDVGTIIVAASPVSFGTTLTEENTKTIPWSATAVPEGAFATKKALLEPGRRAVLALIAANEPILSSKITAPNEAATLSSMLASGKRAVTVRVDDVRGVAGFIQPGDLVDVVLIKADGESGSSQSYSDIILQAAKVLAIDQVTGERTDKPTIAKAVTLEVIPEDAQKILLATSIGHLSLILRQPREVRADNVQRVTAQNLGDMPPLRKTAPLPPTTPHVEIMAQPVAATPPAPRPQTKRIVIWRDLKPQEYDRPLYVVGNQ